MNEERQGDVASTLSEYLSRESRWRLAKACHQALKDDNDDCDERFRKPSPTAILATRLDVTERTIQRWISNRYAIQSCNLNADKLLKAALDLAPKQAREILLEDFRDHEGLLRSFFRIRQPPVAISLMEVPV